MYLAGIALHPYYLTRFSSNQIPLCVECIALHPYYLTRFSNELIVASVSLLLYTLTILQGSQTLSKAYSSRFSFTHLLTYKVLKLQIHRKQMPGCFTHLLTYKVLKQCFGLVYTQRSFTHLLTYKVLKPVLYIRRNNLCFTHLLTYKVLKLRSFLIL